MALGGNGVFEGAGAVESPFVLGDGLREIELQGADGGEGSANGFTVFLEGGWVWMTIWLVSPWRKAFKEEGLLPSSVRGPVESCALARLAMS